MGLTFKVYQGDELVTTETFDRDIIKIGRLSSAHLRLDDEKVSRIHAVVEISTGGDVHIIDMGSAEGTFVNGEKTNKATLKSGDELRLGNTRIVFQAEEEAAAAPAAVATSAAATAGVEAVPGLHDDAEAEAVTRVEAPPAELVGTLAAEAPAPAAPPPRPNDGQAPEERTVSVAPPAVPAAAAPTAPPALPLDERRVSLPPPPDLGDFQDDPTITPVNWAFEIRKMWGETVLDVGYYDGDVKQVLVGEDQKAEFFVPADLLPTPAFPIARVVGGDIMLSFNTNATGNLVMPDGTVTALKELASGPKVSRDPDFGDCKIFALPEGAIATIMFGHVGFRIRYTSKPAGFVSKASDRIDYTFLNTILLVLFVYAAMVATFHLRPKSVETNEEELFKVPDRYVQFILTRPKPQKKDLAFLEKLKSDIDAKADSAERYKGKEGKMGLRGRPDTGKRSAVKAIKPDDKEIGMGNTIGVGRLGTRGRGGGKFGYGTGVARIRRRGERSVNISVGRPIIMGSLSMEIIRRVIRSHRDQIKYCYSKELTRFPNLSGKVSVKFTISPKGYVTQATVSQTTLRNASVERCITQKIRTWKFPEPKGGGIVIVNYPFILQSS
jgi:hypothetical protein